MHCIIVCVFSKILTLACATLTHPLYYTSVDEAEQAMRDLDTSGRGHLTNDKVFELMTEHFDNQRQLFKMKKVLIG